MSDDELFGEAAFDAADAEFEDLEPDFAPESDDESSPSEAESEEGSASDGEAVVDDDATASESPARPEAPRLVDAFARAVQRPRAIHVVDQADRATSDRLQQSEAAGLLSHRAAQIAATGRCFAPPEITAGVVDPVRLAYLELFSRRCPLVLRREVGTAADGAVIVEDWSPRDMVLPVLPMGDGSDPAVFPSL